MPGPSGTTCITYQVSPATGGTRVLHTARDIRAQQLEGRALEIRNGDDEGVAGCEWGVDPTP